jgi:hypothetical protein
MTAARELLDRFAEIGATVRPAAGDHLIVRAGANPVPAELVRQLRQAKAEVLAALAPVGHSPEHLDRGDSERGWWHRHFIIRTIERELGGDRLHPEAERLAFGDMILEWHRRHGDRPDLGRCAGCGNQLPEFAGLVVDHDGVRVHFDAARRDDCIITFGQKWRSAAVAALKELGLDPPVGFELL